MSAGFFFFFNWKTSYPFFFFVYSSEQSSVIWYSLSRYKLKFSPDKIDTMIVQAISLLDDLDKELNNYVMRCREWYGWHFPELGKIVTDNLAYAKTVKTMGKGYYDIMLFFTVLEQGT